MTRLDVSRKLMTQLALSIGAARTNDLPCLSWPRPAPICTETAAFPQGHKRTSSISTTGPASECVPDHPGDLVSSLMGEQLSVLVCPPSDSTACPHYN